MKNNALTVAFLGMLLVSTLITALLTYRYVSSIRKLRGLTPAVIQINNNRNIMQSLANETVEYSKKNPSIDPLLQSVGLKPSANGPAAANTPAAAKLPAK